MADAGNIGSRVLRALNAYLVGGEGCPQPGARGECAAIDFDGRVWLASCSWWLDGAPDSTKLAEIVHQCGGTDVWVFHHLYSDANDDRDGQHPFCGQSLSIQFDAPEQEPTHG